MHSISDSPKTPFWLESQRPRPSRLSSMFCSARALRLLIPAVFFSIIYFWRYPIDRSSVQESLRTSIDPYLHPVTPVYNRTLGFQKLFVLALPDRDDRRTAIQGAANGTNMTLDIIEAIRDEHIPPSGIPLQWDMSNHREGELGCFMSHVKAWREMIASNITSALILESDADWDMRIKPTMYGLAEAAKIMIDWPFSPPEIPTPAFASHPRNFSSSVLEPPAHKIQDPHSPYGQDWDILWVGHCGTTGNGDGRIFAYDDPSAPSDERAKTVKDGPRAGHRPPGNGTRIVFQFHEVMCTTGYALSLSGARRLNELVRSNDENTGGANDPIDKWLWYKCRDDPTIACLSVWPTIFSAAESRTNIGNSDEKADDEISAGKGIQISARVNANLGLAVQGEDNWRREFDTMADKEEKKEDKHEEEKKEHDNKDNEDHDGKKKGGEEEQQDSQNQHDESSTENEQHESEK